MSDTGEDKETAALQGEIDYARMLISRLERLSVDSHWAHRSSGLRGSILRALDELEIAVRQGELHQVEAERRHLKDLIDLGAEILKKGAREIKGDET
ncbi:MAG: hypothetical protein P4L50_27675 [Anaerolineaceae bacterium]|nr:hypothetical protein [Anaerolineaceae bacterium]